LAAYASADVATLNALVSDEVMFHVPGRNPLSGTYSGKDAVFGYLARVAEISESAEGGYDIHAVMADDDHVCTLVTGTIENSGIRFVRPTVHVFHVDGAQVTEFWEASLDQHVEDEFWKKACS
jgi:ketosteroid isomerase-like protein